MPIKLRYDRAEPRHPAGRGVHSGLLRHTLLLCALLGHLPNAPTARADDDEVMGQLCASWKGQKQEIQTAYIRCRRWYFLRDSLKALTPDQVDAAMNAYMNAKDDPPIDTLLDGLASEDVEGRTYKIYLSGSMLREESDQGGVQVFDGDVKIEADPANKQVMIFAPGASRRRQLKLTDFRHVVGDDPALFSLVRRDEGRVFVRTISKAELVADEATGALLRLSFRDKGGRLTREMWQGEFVTYPGGIHFPSFRADARYLPDGQVQLLVLTEILEADFNEEIDDAAFEVGAGEGYNIFDFTKPDVPRVLSPDGPTVDAAELSNRGGPGRAGANGPFQTFIIFNVGILLALAGLYLWRRRSPTNA